ncbi:fungal-specific transcription factor domain-containing protein [Apiospora kogelbergensis]|uniref:fungal-specific transcription factor domain-containing protein n=1 Tax=Apiospora kogelbergensis TaxID=1337665 RepID=UPI0031316533
MNNERRKRKRPYGASCEACRDKKISCDGVRPRCGGCKNTHEECWVPDPVRPLRRLQNPRALERDVMDLADRMRRMEERMREMDESNRPPGTPPAQGSTPATALSHSDTHMVTNPADADHGAKYRLTVDASGNVTYHGLTSWIRGPNVASEAPPQPQPQALSPIPPGMTGDAQYARILQALATSKHISVAPRLGDALLEYYFCYSVFNIIERSTFMRDMALGGPMFSEFLLMAMYTSATSKIDGLNQEERITQERLFSRLAKEYLAKEMEGPTKITTIQGLLLLSGRECATGNLNQGWNHAGLAFRMIHDLGIHLAPENVAGVSNLSYEDRATRDRLFWSAFVWDKAISLAMGREPTFPPRRGRDPISIIDFDDDEGPWTAYYVNPLNCPPQLAKYVYQPKRRAAAFRFLARLCLILHDIIVELYSSEGTLNPHQKLGFIARTRQRLDNLWESMPETMKFNANQQPPPPWIFMLQMLYHASSILLFRTTLSPVDIATAGGHIGVCLEHSITANQMAVSYTQTFGARMTYVAVYSSFVAASFDIMLLEAEGFDIQLDALKRLRVWLGIMEQSVVNVASINKSVHHISTSTRNIVSKNAALAASEDGQWIISLHSHCTPTVTPLDDSDGTGTGVEFFDFFDLLPLCRI